MCQELIPQTKMLCGDKIDSPGTKIPCKDRCGNYKPNHSIGSPRKKIHATIVLRTENGPRMPMASGPELKSTVTAETTLNPIEFLG